MNTLINVRPTMPEARSSSSQLPPETATNSHARLIDVVDALIRRTGAEPWGVRELAADLGESRTTVNRILGALVERGLAAEAGEGKYGIGPRLGVLAERLRRAGALFNDANAELDALAEASGSTVLLSMCCPGSERYFVCNYSAAKAALTFTPELGVPYPLTFGDIGRYFARVMGNTPGLPLQDVAPILAGLANQDPGESGTLLVESEYPRARTLAAVPSANGLLVSLSIHPIEQASPGATGQEEAQLRTVAERLAARMRRVPAVSPTDVPDLPTGNTKLTAARLERLLLLHCLFPQGVIDIVRCHDRLLCNGVTAARLVQSAIAADVSQVRENVTFPGPRLYQWTAKLGVRATSLADWVRPLINDVAQRTGETIALLSFDDASGRSQFLEIIQGWRPIQYRLQTHVDVPLYAGAAGKAVLAFCEHDLAKAIDLQKITDTTITSHEALEKELAAIRTRGWATGDGERVPGAFGVATPFFADGQIRGAISATVPRYRKDDLDVPGLARQMLEASQKITAILSI